MDSLPQTQFFDYLSSRQVAVTDKLRLRFQTYLDNLFELNRQVNLVSRQMPGEVYWTQHLLDSLLILECVSLRDEMVLDFGSGGGLPGIPLSIACPGLRMTLLDGVNKKVRCLQDIVSRLKLPGVTAVRMRLEDFADRYEGMPFDYILCRGVRLEERFIAPMLKLLQAGGNLICYKAVRLDDVLVFPNPVIREVSHPALGIRKLVIIPHSSLQQYALKRNLI